MTNYDLDHQITCIDTKHIRSDFVASYLIRSGSEFAFVDTGSHLSVPNILQELIIKNINCEQVKYVFTTHIHLDHAGGAGRLMRHLPEAKLVVHPRGYEHLINPQKLKNGVIKVYGKPFFNKYLGNIIPIEKNRVIAMASGVISLNGRQLSLIDTPGHAFHHYSIFDEQSGGIFSGDTLGVSYAELNRGDDVLIFPPTSPTQFAPNMWLKTIDKLLKFKPKYAYLTHFNRIRFNQATAEQLKIRISDMAEIAMQHKTYNSIKFALTDYLLTATKNYCALNEKAKIKVLKEDIEICTKGLLAWLDYCKKN